MKKNIFLIILLFSFYNLTTFAQLQRGDRTIVANGEYMEVKPAGGLGLDNIYVFKSRSGSSISYTTNKNKAVSFYTYTNSIADKEGLTLDIDYQKMPPVGDNVTYVFNKLQDSKGLILDDGMKLHLWIIDYSLHRPQLNSITPVDSEDKCEALKLMIDKSDLLEYKGTGGQTREIEREYSISYNTLKWNKEEGIFEKETIVKTEKGIGTEYILYDVPKTNTKFKLEGDQFGKKFNNLSEITTLNEYTASAVEAHIVAKQRNSYTDNGGAVTEESELGGSAPIDIEFFGHGNKPVATFFTWFIYKDNDKSNPVARYTDEDFEYTFDQSGDYQVMLEVANAESTCVDTTSVTFNISVSDLKVSNYFSPNSTPGVNDVWKVFYKSLTKYKCVIFNRWGNKVFESSNPEEGWDGKYKGRFVHPGVYYYSIEATGSDGIKYKKGGDINILK